MPIDLNDVLKELEQDRQNGTLPQDVASGIRYQTSVTHQGCIEQIHPDGKIVVGLWVDGKFKPIEQRDSSVDTQV